MIGYSYIDSVITPSSIGDIEIHKSEVTRFHNDGTSTDSGVQFEIYFVETTYADGIGFYSYVDDGSFVFHVDERTRTVFKAVLNVDGEFPNDVEQLARLNMDAMVKANTVDEGNEWNEKTVAAVGEIVPLLKSLYGDGSMAKE